MKKIINTKFSFFVLVPSLMSIGITFLMILIFENVSRIINEIPIFDFIMLILIPTLIWVVIVLGELRTKTFTISIIGKKIIKASFLGLGIKKELEINHFTGFKVFNFPSKNRTYEYLYLIKDGNRTLIATEFYHRNYFQVKGLISNQLVDLGTEELTFLSGLKSVFQS